MNLRRQRQLLWLMTGGMALASAAVLAWGLSSPPPISANSAGGAAKIARRTATAPSSASRPQSGPAEPPPGPDELLELAELALRRPLRDAPQHDVTPPPTVPLPVRLAGMAFEPNQPNLSCAILEKADGSRVLCSQGQTIEDPAGPVTVVRIEHQQVIVQYHGETTVLTPPPPPEGAAP